MAIKQPTSLQRPGHRVQPRLKLATQQLTLNNLCQLLHSYKPTHLPTLRLRINQMTRKLALNPKMSNQPKMVKKLNLKPLEKMRQKEIRLLIKVQRLRIRLQILLQQTIRQHPHPTLTPVVVPRPIPRRQAQVPLLQDPQIPPKLSQQMTNLPQVEPTLARAAAQLIIQLRLLNRQTKPLLPSNLSSQNNFTPQSSRSKSML